MGTTSDIRKGVVINHQGDLYVVSDFQFVNPGKGSAFTKTKMKNIATGKTIEITYKSSESVETVQVDYVNMQYLYKNNEMYSFMNQETYETFEVNADVLGDDVKYLKEGLDVVMAVYQGAIISMQLPKKITYKVVDAPPAVKGNSASGNISKRVTLDNDLVINAPIFIKVNEEIVVNTETGEYCNRANE